MSPGPADTNVGATVAWPLQAAGSGDFPVAGSSPTLDHSHRALLPDFGLALLAG